MKIVPFRERRPGFTLIELMVSMAIVSVLTGLLLPAVVRVREAAWSIQCASNMKQLGLAIHHYYDIYSKLPPSRLDSDGGVSWAVLLLPYVGEDNLYQHWDLRQRYYAHEKWVRQGQSKLYHCPSKPLSLINSRSGDIPEDGWPQFAHYSGCLSSYAVCSGNDNWTYGTGRANGAFVSARRRYKTPYILSRWNSRTSLESISDGMSNTFLVGEKHVIFSQIGRTGLGDGSIFNGDHNRVVARVAGPNHPLAKNFHEPFNHQFGSYHPEVVHFTMGDGSVRSLAKNADPHLLGLLAVRNDGQPIPDF